MFATLSPRHNVTALFGNMIFGDEDKIVPVISYVSWRDIMQDSWGQNFRTKNGRQVSLTGCSGSSKARWTDVRAATDCEVPARMKNGHERYDSESRGRTPNWQHSPWNIMEGSLTGIPKSSVVRIIRRDLQMKKCFKRRRGQELTEAKCTVCKLLLIRFFQFAATLSCLQMKKVFTVDAAVKELWKSVKISPS